MKTTSLACQRFLLALCACLKGVKGDVSWVTLLKQRQNIILYKMTLGKGPYHLVKDF